MLRTTVPGGLAAYGMRGIRSSDHLCASLSMGFPTAVHQSKTLSAFQEGSKCLHVYVILNIYTFYINFI